VTDKRFTLEEANALLPALQEDLKQLQALMRQMEERSGKLQGTKAKLKQSRTHIDIGIDPFFEEESRLEFMRIEAELLISNFSRKGVLLKMIEPGLLDFPAVVDGEEVLICWKEGEARISHYHGWHDGFAGRKPFPPDPAP